MILTREGKEIVAIYKQDGDEVDEVKDANGRLVYTNTREITGTLPLSFTSRGKPLADYRISGNTVQDGTPTPDAPVDVVGCGGRTENLFDKNNTTVYSAYINADQKWFIVQDISKSIRIPVSSNTQYTLSISEPNSLFRIYETNVDNPEPSDTGTLLSEIVRGTDINRYTFTTASDTKFIVFQASGINVNEWLNSLMLSLGSSPLPYEPYGYKLPLTINGTEYPIYLGEVQSARKIKKLVLTGEETFGYANLCFTYTFDGKPTSVQPIKAVIFSNAYDGVEPRYRDQLRNYECCITRNYNQMAIRDNNYTDVADFKAYLAAQYAAGTPVTVWYILANPETSVVNEPLMKIGNYADTITMAQAGVTIPTIRGTNVLDMTTPVKPSEVYIKGKGIRAIT